MDANSSRSTAFSRAPLAGGRAAGWLCCALVCALGWPGTFPGASGVGLRAEPARERPRQTVRKPAQTRRPNSRADAAAPAAREQNAGPSTVTREADRAPVDRGIEDSWLRQIHQNGAPAGRGTAPATPPAGVTESAQNSDSNSSANPNASFDPGERLGPAADGSGDRVQFANPGEESSATSGSLRSPATSAPPAAGTETGTGIFGEANEQPSFLSVVVRFFGLMAVMVALFYLVVRYMRTKSGLPVMGGHELVQVVASVPLVQGKFLQIVDVAGRLFILGVSESGVQMLSPLDDGVAADRVRVWQSRQSVAARQPAGSLLEKISATLKNSDFRFWSVAPAGAASSPPNFQEWLDRQGAVAPGARPVVEAVPAGAARRAPVEAAEPVGGAVDTPDLFPVPARDEDDLKVLLRQQRQRLAGLKRGESLTESDPQ